MDADKLKEMSDKLNIGKHSRHVFLCPGQACCSKEAGNAAWDALKKECEVRGITPGTDELSIARTKAGCLRVCSDGPVAVVYP